MNMQNMKRSETTEQIALFSWAKRTESILPELALLYHVPNEGKRTNGGILKAAGLKSGVPDICLPAANNGFHGLYIELKFGDNKATKDQEEYMAKLETQGYKTAVCYGAEEARAEILGYLQKPGKTPLEKCIAAPWVNGKCEGRQISKMFSRESCRACERHGLTKAEMEVEENMGKVPHSFRKPIIKATVDLSAGKPLPGNTLENTLEIISQNLAELVKSKWLTVKQSAAVLTVAMKAYEVGKKEREKHENKKSR